jgi:Na+-translocating ferredoxin:NAD+ oxidoreductase RnfE subunit
MRRHTIAVMVSLACVLPLTLSACATTVPTETTSIIEGNDILTADLGTDVTAKGVVLAAVVLVAGNVDKALGDGTVTQGEVDAAREAIANGNLDLWRQRAEADGTP